MATLKEQGLRLLNKVKSLIFSVLSKNSNDVIDEASEESFPASDPPAWAAGHHEKQAEVTSEKDIIDKLEHEHHVIMHVMYATSNIIKKENISQDTLQRLIDFIQHFIVNYHHKKIDEVLCPLLEKNNIKLTDMQFKTDHQTCQKHLVVLQTMKTQNANPKELIDQLTKIKDLYPIHMLQEENSLFKFAKKSLDTDMKATLASEFDQIEKNLSPYTYEQLIELAEKLHQENI